MQTFEVETNGVGLFQHYRFFPDFYLVGIKLNCGCPLRLRTSDSGLYSFFFLLQGITFGETKVHQISYRSIFREEIYRVTASGKYYITMSRHNLQATFLYFTVVLST